MNDFLAKKYQGILIQFLGSDGQAFLQRLTSIDITKVKEGDMVLSAFLDAKASIIAIFYVFKKDSYFNLLVSETYKNDAIGYIEKMHFSEDLKLNIKDMSWLEMRYKDMPFQLDDVSGYIVRSWSVNQKNIKGQILLSTEMNHLKDDTVAFLEKSINKQQFDLLECHALSPGIDSNLFRYIMILDGPFDHLLSRDKGCYPGQEVVEKIYSIGRRPKKMLCCQIDTPLMSINVPETLLAENKKVGKLLCAFQKDEQVCMGLAILRHTCSSLEMVTELKKYQVRVIL